MQNSTLDAASPAIAPEFTDAEIAASMARWSAARTPAPVAPPPPPPVTEPKRAAGLTGLFHALAAEYFKPKAGASATSADWTADYDPACTIVGTDEERLAFALKAKSVGAKLGSGKATFADCWNANAEALARTFPGNDGDLYDASSADQSVANHLAYWFGNNCEAILRVLREHPGCKLRRDKWDREDYIRGTILKACALPKDWKPRRDTRHVPAPAAPPPVGTTPPAAPASLPSVPFGVMHYGMLRTNLRGDPIADEENVRLLLENEPNLQGIVRFDEFSGELLLVRPITADADLIGERGLPRPWSDADTATLQTFIQKHHIPKISREKIDAIVSMYARQRCAFHPVRDYLQSLTWDKQPRLNTWLRDYMGAGTQSAEYLAAVGPAWLISAIARIFEPGCQADCALVLEGAQGIRKSTALRTLSGDDYFSDSLPADLAHKDARDHLRGKWIIELPELAQFRRTEIETVKAFLSRRHEQYRPSYGRHEVRFPRQCVMAGSTNDDSYLVDTTGNRRFWVVACTRVNLEALKQDRDQLWAEAAARYRAGESWHLEGRLEAIAAAEAAERVAHDPWTSEVADIVAAKLTGPDASAGEVMHWMSLPPTERHARNATRVGTILNDLGWKRGKRHMTRGQLYVRPAFPPPPMKL